MACDGGPAAPEAGRLEYSSATLALGEGRQAMVILRNTGAAAVGPVEFFANAVVDGGGGAVPGVVIGVSPTDVSTLNPGGQVSVTVSVQVPDGLQPGTYRTEVVARSPDLSSSLELTFLIAQDLSGLAARVVIGQLPSTLRQGDAVPVTAEILDAAGSPLEGGQLQWRVSPAGMGFFSGDRFVPYGSGPASVIARVGGTADTVEITVSPRGLAGSFLRVGHGLQTDRFSSDLWVREGYAYLGSWSARGSGDTQQLGNTLYTWDVSDPVTPVLVNELRVDARTVNDVKVHPNGRLALITHEGSEDGLNGVTLLDLSDPAAPRPIVRSTEGLQSGVHNAWLDGNHAYLVVDGGGGGLRVLDISDPALPRTVASFYAGTSFLHDVYVRDGLAFLSHWNAGFVVLDVGDGRAGGSPDNPVEVSRISELGRQTHNAWYWPETGYVFVGEEDFSTPGRMHVVDFRDPWNPREVASFSVPGQTPHNFWLDEERGILYLAWYGQGVRALDVTGELLGDLTHQGREIAGLLYNGGPGSCDRIASTCNWAPQLEGGLLYLSDVNSGLVILRPEF
ncbi:MAG TPA: hypothetical protein VGA70_03645 [Longimicrobiales bacterium]|jgi:hypothetical protein